MNAEELQKLKALALKIRKNVIEAGYHSGVSAHYGGSLSAVEMLAYIFSVLKKENAENRDRFILSKGHCALGLYAALEVFGWISHDDLFSFDQNGGDFPTHCVQNLQKGIELSSGSLAMGLSFAIGQALALKAKGLNNTIFVLAGNGEANEGAFWEAVMFAGAYQINNLVLVLDDNKMQLDGDSQSVLPVAHWKEKLLAFGWDVAEVDGNNLQDIAQAFEKRQGFPFAVVANTIKGKGIPFMENAKAWHHGKLSEAEFEAAMQALEN